MNNLDFDFDGFILDAESLINRDKKHQLMYEENLKLYEEDCEENGMSMNEMLDYCNSVGEDNVVEKPELEAKEEKVEGEHIEEINSLSNQIVPSKEHIINMFSSEFVENIEKVMSIRVEQLKNSNHKFKFINIPSSFQEKSQENFKQMFFHTPGMSGGSSHYSKSTERTGSFGEGLAHVQNMHQAKNMQQTFQGTHRLEFMMTLKSTVSSFENHFKRLMQNVIPAIEYQNHPANKFENQMEPLNPNEQQPTFLNQLQKIQNKPVPTKDQPAILVISSSDEDPPAVKLKLNPKINENANKENRCANTQKSIAIIPKKCNKKLKRKERQRSRLPSESSDENENDSLRSRRLNDFFNGQSDGKKHQEINGCLNDEQPVKNVSVVLVDCFKSVRDIDIGDVSSNVFKAVEDEQVLEYVNEDIVRDIEEEIVEENGNNDIGDVSSNVFKAVEDEQVLEYVNEDIVRDIEEEIVEENGNNTDFSISTITSDDEKFFNFQKYDLLRKQKRQLMLHERSIKRGVYSDYKPESISIIESSISHPVACSTLIQIVSPPKSKSPQKAEPSKRKLPITKSSYLKLKKNRKIADNISSDNESNSSISTITSDDVKFFEKDKYDKLRDKKRERAERKKKN